MASGCHLIKEVIVLKFDMHTFVSNMTVDDVNSVVEVYEIPLDLHSLVPSSTITMNKLLVDVIALPMLKMTSLSSSLDTCAQLGSFVSLLVLEQLYYA
ncbi:hypothetical protein Tco_0853965 [Tanacetum coccineum]